jgi:hypothetical protein
VLDEPDMDFINSTFNPGGMMEYYHISCGKFTYGRVDFTQLRMSSLHEFTEQLELFCHTLPITGIEGSVSTPAKFKICLPCDRILVRVSGCAALVIRRGNGYNFAFSRHAFAMAPLGTQC